MAENARQTNISSSYHPPFAVLLCDGWKFRNHVVRAYVPMESSHNPQKEDVFYGAFNTYSELLTYPSDTIIVFC